MQSTVRTAFGLQIVAALMLGPPLTPAAAQVPGAATLAGTVRDASGKPLASVDVLLRSSDTTRQTVRTSEKGEFTVANVAPGAYAVWFRHASSMTVAYNWAARWNEKSQVTVAVAPIPKSLDAKLVRSEEDKMLAGSSSLLGLVVDTEGKPIPEVDVQLMGTDLSGTTRANGGFLFKPLPLGAYVVRVRKPGFLPMLLTKSLSNAEQAELIVVLLPLPAGLSEGEMAERGGFASDQKAFDALEKRMRWQLLDSHVLGPEELKQFEGATLETAVLALGGAGGVDGAPARDGKVPFVVKKLSASEFRALPLTPPGMRPDAERTGDACILLNGRDAVRRKLGSFPMNDVKFLEVYPTGTEPTGTVAEKMNGSCSAKSALDHPTWYVIWTEP